MNIAAATTLSILACVAFAAPALAETPPPERRHLNLTIHHPPRAPTEDTRGRVICGVEGSLRADDPRVWIGPPVPAHVPAGLESLELFHLVPTDGGHLALYRDMFGRDGVPGCAAANMWDNCRWRARFYSNDGALRDDIDLNALMDRTDHLRIGDVAIVGDVLYTNFACQTYAAEAKGKCSQMLAIRLGGAKPEVLWTSKFLVSNTQILPIGEFLVTGYGFTDEKDVVHIVHQKDGKVVKRIPVPKAPEGFVLNGDVLEVVVYGRPEPIRFKVTGFAATEGPKGRTRAASPKLERIRD
jgi:hypothetical protein